MVKSRADYENWKAGHEEECQKNYDGTSGKGLFFKYNLTNGLPSLCVYVQHQHFLIDYKNNVDMKIFL